MIRFFLPKDTVYFDELDRMCVNIAAGTTILRGMLEEGSNHHDLARRLKQVEHETDEIAHRIMARLRHTFVTPFRREVIFQMVGRLDDILDAAEDAGSHIELYQPERIPIEAPELGATLQESARLIGEIVGSLRDVTKQEPILERIREVKRLEHEADCIRRASLARLSREEPNVIELIKCKDILEFMEKGTDRCEDVADIAESIVISYS